MIKLRLLGIGPAYVLRCYEHPLLLLDLKLLIMIYIYL